jgi:hypothetical protein
MNFRYAPTLLFVVALPLSAQVEGVPATIILEPPAAAAPTQVVEERSIAAAAQRPLKIISNATANFLPKYADGSGSLADSIVSEVGGMIGIGVTPQRTLHVFGAGDGAIEIESQNTSGGTSASAALRTRSNTATTTFASHGSGRTLARFGQVLGGWSEILSSTGNGLIMGTSTSTPLILGTNSLERFRIYPNGHVSIGYPTDQGRLGIFEYAHNTRAMTMVLDTTIDTNMTVNEIGALMTGQQRVAQGVSNSGSITGTQMEAWNLGLGHLSAATGLRILTGNYPGFNGSTMSTATGLNITVMAGAGSVTNGYGIVIQNVAGSSDYGIYQIGTDDDNYFGGRVGIGINVPQTGKVLHVVGDSLFQGSVIGNNIRAQYQDLAEWVPASEDLAPGTVVVLDNRSDNTVKASTRSYDTAVAGVVSAQPGILLGEESASKEQVATTGRVRVRVDASKVPIAIGDLLVTSDVPGTAMKSAPLDLGGVAIHRPGTIIGKALEPLDRGTGEILVLLSMQ